MATIIREALINQRLKQSSFWLIATQFSLIVIPRFREYCQVECILRHAKCDNHLLAEGLMKLLKNHHWLILVACLHHVVQGIA